MKKEIKDIQYFLDKENEYISTHKNDGKIIEDGTGIIDADFHNPEYFLKKGKIQWYYNSMYNPQNEMLRENKTKRSAA